LKKAKATGGAFGQAYGGAAPAASLYRSAFCKSKMSHHGPYRSTLGKSFKYHQFFFQKHV
jgi:hypothetical protein